MECPGLCGLRLGRTDVTLRQLTVEGDLCNEDHNACRQQMLADYRGYRRRGYRRDSGLFWGFPDDAKWRRVELEPADLSRLRYCADQSWKNVSNETRDPAVVAQRIARGELAGSNLADVIAIQKRLRQNDRLAELLIAEAANDNLVLLEGHYRATAFVGLNWPENVPAFVASSPAMKLWRLG
jgi:hypothetical protein